MVSIRYKLLSIIVLGLLVMGIIFGSIMIKINEDTLTKNYVKEVQTSKKTYYNLLDNDVKMLKASMIDFMTNQDYKDKFLENDRESLYNYGQELFAKHKALGITHFYFHRLNGTVFARIHNANKYNDPVGRETYAKSVASKSWGTGIELGATAFALRVVHPYYNGDEMIGYIEYGEEIDHINEIMSKTTGNQFATIVNKEYIAEDKWASVTETKGIRNNYNDLPNYVVIESTNPEFTNLGEKCWSEVSIASVSKEGNIFGKFIEGGKTYVCGGFALYDVKDRNVGAVVVIKDVTSLEAASSKSKQYSILLTVLLIVIIGAIVLVLTNNMIVNPIKKLTQAGNKINEGDLNVELPTIKSKDEIKELSNTMNSLIEGIKFFKK